MVKSAEYRNGHNVVVVRNVGRTGTKVQMQEYEPIVESAGD